MSGVSSENQECGIRHRFDVVYRDRVPGHHPQQVARLLHWCEVFDAEGLAPPLGGSSAGNLSFRTASGFVITPSRSELKSGLIWTDLVEIVRADYRNFSLHVRGPRVPSSDSLLHDQIYAQRLDVQAVFHGHDDLILKHAQALAREFSLVLTAESRLFGTVADALETARDLGSSDFIIRTGHGFVAAARTLDLAGQRSLQIHQAALRLEQRPAAR